MKRKVCIRTNTDVQTAIGKLREATGPRQLVHVPFQHPVFEGEVTNEGFRLHRILNYWSSFRAEIRGKVEQQAPAVFSVSFSVHPLIWVFLGIWTLLCVFGLLGLSAAIVLLSLAWPFVLIPVALLAFAWTLVLAGSAFELNRSERALREALTG